MSDGERHWIEAARRGDHVAFRRLVEAHARPMHALAYRILGDAALAEDAVQDAMLNAYRHLPGFDGRAGFRTWLHRIVVNAALALRRGAPAELPLDDDAAAAAREVAVPRHEEPVARADAAQIGAGLAAALAQLTPMERTAFVLRHVEQHPLEEIAQVLAINVNATKQAIFRAVRKLRPALADWSPT
jgi:RNA polymerase sigma-70 factor, ECF subfamily